MNPLLPRYTQWQTKAEDDRKISRIVVEANAKITSTTIFRGTAAGDERRLRGIPVVARGVPGASPGTTP